MTPTCAFNFVLPSAAHLIAPAIVPRRFQRLLSLGTTFIAADTRTVKRQLSVSLDQFERTLAWAQVFGWSRRPGETYSFFKPSGNAKTPSLEGPTLEYFQRVKSQLMTSLTSSRLQQSHFIREIWEFKSWAGNNLVVKPSDKNLGLTVMTRDFYRDLCLTYLDKCCELHCSGEKGIRSALHTCKGNATMLLNQAQFQHWVCFDVVKWLRDREDKVSSLPFLYILPKLHKSPIAARPIVAAHSCPLAACSMWLGKVLLPVASRCPAYLRDSSHLISDLISKTWPTDCVILTFDVESMYPNMRRAWMQKALQWALRHCYERQPSWTPLASGIIDLLFTQCFMVFEDKVYRQKDGIAMGTNAAPLLANIYLAELEQAIHSDPEVLYYKRFIDDGFALLRSRAAAERTLCTLKKSGLSFTHTMSDQSGVFLDLEVYKGPLTKLCGLLHFRTYRKAMNRFLYLPAFSAHHPACIRSWVYAEVLRLRNTCLTDEDFLYCFNFFLRNLLKRGYSSKLIGESLDMLPVPLLSPLARPSIPTTPLKLVSNDGQVSVDAPPKVFRAPYNLHQHVAYGTIIHQDLIEVTSYLDKRAGLANLNPTPSLAPLITIANTHLPSLKKLLVSARL